MVNKKYCDICFKEISLDAVPTIIINKTYDLCEEHIELLTERIEGYILVEKAKQPIRF
jgi:hypothetical protein